MRDSFFKKSQDSGYIYRQANRTDNRQKGCFSNRC